MLNSGRLYNGWGKRGVPKNRPSRLYKKKDKVFYTKDGKKYLVANQQQHVIINISNAKRQRQPIGKPQAAKVSTQQLMRDFLLRQAFNAEQKLINEREQAALALRMKQIKEEAHAVNEREKQALQAEHKKEQAALLEMKKTETAQAQLEIERLRAEAAGKDTLILEAKEAELEKKQLALRIQEERETQTKLRAQQEQTMADAREAELANHQLTLRLAERDEIEARLRAQNAALASTNQDFMEREKERKEREASQPARLRRRMEAIDRKVAQQEAKQEAAQQAAQDADDEDTQEDTQYEAGTELTPQSELQRPVRALPPGHPIWEDYPLELPQADPEQVGRGNALHKSSLPNGLSNEQLDDLMSDEPRYLKTVSADEVDELKHAAKTISDDYEEFGFIVNLDKRDEQNREHWCAVYVDPDNEKVMYYYDPFGEPPNETINNELKRLIKHFNLPYYLSFQYNQRKTQNLNSNRCGIHCMMFLREMFEGRTTDEATDHDEKEAREFQNKYLI
jgi:hypothetical protein